MFGIPKIGRISALPSHELIYIQVVDNPSNSEQILDKRLSSPFHQRDKKGLGRIARKWPFQRLSQHGSHRQIDLLTLELGSSATNYHCGHYMNWVGNM
ncbi:hypothetical protein CEXT_178451 [Caerostris extrusa]|uniref:Uncharacterized protein n=1 Tax=Caerostris extrusa TaxID=172846 RepID=A0AAV4R9H4_CAEEX|nr:hypothetical protein CEXT_178451 [Caerostris extrusa]